MAETDTSTTVDIYIENLALAIAGTHSWEASATPEWVRELYRDAARAARRVALLQGCPTCGRAADPDKWFDEHPKEDA